MQLGVIELDVEYVPRFVCFIIVKYELNSYFIAGLKLQKNYKEKCRMRNGSVYFVNFLIQNSKHYFTQVCTLKSVTSLTKTLPVLLDEKFYLRFTHTTRYFHTSAAI